MRRPLLLPLPGMQTLLAETSTSRKEIKKTDLRMRKNRLNADIGCALATFGDPHIMLP